MLIGVPKEVKNHEYRVAVSPDGVRELAHHGHQVMVESNAGSAIGFDDNEYRNAGAMIVSSAEEVWSNAELIVKVKEPQAKEGPMIQEGQVLFCYLHLAPDPKQTDMLVDSGCVAIAYETVTGADGRLPLLAPMSEVAGRVSIQAGAWALEEAQGGRGVLLSGVPGVAAGDVVVLGGGNVGMNAALMAVGMGAKVTILEKDLRRLRELDKHFGSRVNTIYATVEAVEKYVCNADLIIGAVLVPGGAAPILVKKELLPHMRRGAVVVDVAIDQGGCFESSRPTTHDDPIFKVSEVVHYCVTNMPSAVSRTATLALEHATLPYIIALADKGYRVALREDEHFRNGLNVHRGKITHEAVANALNRPYVPPKVVLG